MPLHCYMSMQDVIKLIQNFKHLINHQLPSAYTQPVRFNHCFNRIILDWLYKDCWYNHLDKDKTALSQLDEHQLHAAIKRMHEWLHDKQTLVDDNNASLQYRHEYKNANHTSSALFLN